MTCSEKLKSDHPRWTIDDIQTTIFDECPNHYGYLDRPNYCDSGRKDTTCEKCWNREIPEDKKEKKEMPLIITETGDSKIFIDMTEMADSIVDIHRKFTSHGFTCKESFELINKLLDAQLRCIE